jgi:hypothetical protein
MRIPAIMHHAVECSCANYLELLEVMNNTKSIQLVNQITHLLNVTG